MSESRALNLRVSDAHSINAGSWHQCSEDEIQYRLIVPPSIPMHQQVVDYLTEGTKDQKVPPKSQLHFGEVALATALVCIRWGSYFGVLTQDLPQWTPAHDPKTSYIQDSEMARINIEASAALASWIDLMRSDQALFRKLVKAAVRLLPSVVAVPDPKTYYKQFHDFSFFNSAKGRRYLVEEAFVEDFGKEYIDAEKARILVNPTRYLANGILSRHWRDTGEVENVHAGRYAPLPLLQRRLTREQERAMLENTAQHLVPVMHMLYNVVTKAKPEDQETWPEQVLPYAITPFRSPSNWSLEEQTRQIKLFNTEP